MSSSVTRESARELLKSFVSKQEASGTDVAVDILRVLQSEAQLLYETQSIQDLFDQDPFQCFYDDGTKELPTHIQTFRDSIEVTSCHRVEKDDNYCFTQAVVQCPCASPDKDNNSSSSPPPTKKHKRQPKQATPNNKTNKTTNNFIQLHFRYERDPATASTPTTIWYSIDLSIGYGPKQNIVTIRVWADGNKPSRLPAVSMEDDQSGGSEQGDDDLEDTMEEDDESDKDAKMNGTKPSRKHGQTTSPADTASKNDTANANNEDHDEEEESRDRYACYVDPEGLQLFQETTNLTALDEATTFFTLMTFPFYQHEFDLVGFVLDSIFGEDSDDDDDEDEDNDEDKDDSEDDDSHKGENNSDSD